MKSLKVLSEVLPRVLRQNGVLRGVLPRVLREIGGAPESAPCGASTERALLGAPPGAAPNFPEHSRERSPEHPDFPEHPWEHSREHFQGFTTLAPLWLADGIATLDRYRTPSAIGSAIGRPPSRPFSHPNTGESPQLPRSKPLGGLNRAIVALYCPKPALNQSAPKERRRRRAEIQTVVQKGVFGESVSSLPP